MSVLSQMTALSRASDKQRKKQQMSDAKKFAKMLIGMGKDVAFSATANGYQVTSIAQGTAPLTDEDNEWDEELAK